MVGLGGEGRGIGLEVKGISTEDDLGLVAGAGGIGGGSVCGGGDGCVVVIVVVVQLRLFGGGEEDRRIHLQPTATSAKWIVATFNRLVFWCGGFGAIEGGGSCRGSF